MIEKYENQSLDEIASLLLNDKLTFSVLVSILSYPCQKIITDKKHFIICYSCSPFPVWVWTLDNTPNEVYEQVCDIINMEFDKKDKFFFNVKYEFFQYLKNHDKMNDWFVSTNMLTYDCPHPIPPKKQAEGSLTVATMEDFEITRMLIRGVFDATSEKRITEKECDDITKSRIVSGNLYLWKSNTGNAVAMSYVDYGFEFGKVTLVYTNPSERRKGYASRIVYEVSCLIADKGLMPILYTDGDYDASNECYKGIGYIERGCLYSISKN